MNSSLRVLLVEDSENDALIIIHILKAGGYEPVWERVETAAAMCKALLEQPWDLILSDYRLPRFNGLEALALLKETGIDIPFILVSGTIGEETAVAAMKAGAHDFVMKDKLSRLIPAIDRELKEAEVRRKGKWTEEALRESLEVEKSILLSVPHALFGIEQRRIFFANEAMEDVFGWKPEELIGKSTRIIFRSDEEWHAYGAILYARLETQAVYVFESEIPFIRRDGREIFCRMSVSRIGKELGESRRIVATFEDITYRKEAEKALIESERRLSDIIEFLPDATMVIDKEGKVIAWNRAIEVMTGVKASEILGQGDCAYAIPFYGDRRPILIDLALHPDPELEKNYTAIQREGDILFGEAYTPSLPTGIAHLSATASVFRDSDGEIIAAIECIRDNTERRQMEEALASEHDRLAAILDGIPIPAFMIDINNTVVLWNRNNEIFTGAIKMEMLGKKLDLGFLFKGKTPPTLAELVLIMTDEQILKKYGSRGVFKSDIFPGAFESIGTIFPLGEERIMFIQAARIFDPKGELIGAVQTAQDITERIRMQKEREKLQSQLIQAQKMEAIGTLAGGIAHDFNNILSGIMGYSELCLKAVQDRPKARHSLKQVLRAADRAKDLVQQILTFSRKTEQQKRPVMFATIVKEVMKFVRASLPTTIEIRQSIEESSDVIMADPTQMHQVLMNLCTNAGHAMRERGGVLEIGLKEIVVAVRDSDHSPSLPSGRYLELSVRDTGHGISRKNIEKIFDPYFTTKEKGEGTGLGLAVVHGIVKDHGGDIRVFSEEEKGTVFSVYLPLIDKQKEKEERIEEDIQMGKGEMILFVDDENMVVDMSRELLEDLGYRVITETSPVKAVEVFQARRNAFDLVITDKTMPHWTGYDLAGEIRKISATIPIIMCSGFQEKGDMEKLVNLGISRLITKPIRMRVLAQAIRNVLDKADPETQQGQD